MGGEIRREYEGRDQREIRLRRPIEENPADDGGTTWIRRLRISIECVRNCHRHARNVLDLLRRGVLLTASDPHIASGLRQSLRFLRPKLALTHGGFLMSSLAAGRHRIFATIVLIAAFCVPAQAQERSRDLYTPPAADAIHAVPAEHGMVVAQEKLAARIGADVLKHGGNAVDAAVATGFAMAVTYPRAGNIGGGGFMVIHSQDRHEDVAID